MLLFLIDILHKSLIPDKLAALHKPQAESCQVVRTLILIQKTSNAHAQLQVIQICGLEIPIVPAKRAAKSTLHYKRTQEGLTLVKYSE